MKRLIVLSLVLLVAMPAVAQADTAKLLGDLAAKTTGALAVIRYTVEIETGSRTVMGQGICIASQDDMGVFMTSSLDSRLRVESLKSFEVILPGVDGKVLKAKLLGIDPWTNLGFVQATEAHKWQVVEFAPASSVKLGQQVTSIGLIMGDASRPVYVGSAHVSSKLRVPDNLIYVTGGWLTGRGSAVFGADGRAIGIVGPQLFLPFGFQVPNRKGTAPMQLQSQQQSSFFTPVEEFGHVVRNYPSDGKISRLPWMGVNKFLAVSGTLAETLKLGKPAVQIDEVIPDHPADKAGLANRDIIIGIGGQEIEKLATPELSARNFVRKLMRMRPGATVKLQVISGRDTKDIDVKLNEMPTLPGEAKHYFNRAIGLQVREKVMLDEFLDKTASAKVDGLLVVAMAQGSPAVTAGLQQGDVITNVNNQPVKTVQTFRQIVEGSLAVSTTAPINFLIFRGGSAQVITVKPGG